MLNSIYGKRKTVVRLEIEKFLEVLKGINCSSIKEPLQDYISLVERGLARAQERGIAQIARIEIRLGN